MTAVECREFDTDTVIIHRAYPACFSTVLQAYVDLKPDIRAQVKRSDAASPMLESKAIRGIRVRNTRRIIVQEWERNRRYQDRFRSICRYTIIESSSPVAKVANIRTKIVFARESMISDTFAKSSLSRNLFLSQDPYLAFLIESAVKETN